VTMLIETKEMESVQIVKRKGKLKCDSSVHIRNS